MILIEFAVASTPHRSTSTFVIPPTVMVMSRSVFFCCSSRCLGMALLPESHLGFQLVSEPFPVDRVQSVLRLLCMYKGISGPG